MPRLVVTVTNWSSGVSAEFYFDLDEARLLVLFIEGASLMNAASRFSVRLREVR